MWGTSLFYQMFTATILETQRVSRELSDPLAGILQPRRPRKSVRRTWWFYAASHFLRLWVFVAKRDCLHSPAPDTGGRVASFVWNPELGLNLWLEIFQGYLKSLSGVSSESYLKSFSSSFPCGDSINIPLSIFSPCTQYKAKLLFDFPHPQTLYPYCL